MLKTSGTNFVDGDTVVFLNGVNDTTVFAWMQGNLRGTYVQYKWSNHNFPQYIKGATTDADTNTKIPATTYREFFHKYFWILKNLGGNITADLTNSGQVVPITGSTSLNHVRFGPHDSWARELQHKAFYQRRTEYDAIMKDMFDEAEIHGVYITLNLGGDSGNQGTTLFGGDIYEIKENYPSTTEIAFNNYVTYCVDYIMAYSGRKMLAMFDLCNEPCIVANLNSYWTPKYTNGKAAYWAWKNKLVTTVKAQLIAKGMTNLPLLTVGNGSHVMPNPSYPSSLVEYANWHENLDVITEHPYWGADDETILRLRRDAGITLGKPTYYEEMAYNQTTTSPDSIHWLSYWPWADLMCKKYNINKCWMQLNSMPSPTPTGGAYVHPQPAYPGYPVSATTMNSIPATEPISVPLTVEISCSPTTGFAPLTVSFVSTITGGMAPYTYVWDFDDGSQSSESNPIKTITKLGTTSVHLHIVDAGGNLGLSNSIQVMVEAPPIPEPVGIGYLPGFDIEITPEQIQQGQISVKIPDVVGSVPVGSTSATATTTSVKVLGKTYPITVPLPVLKVFNPSFKIIMPTITFNLPDINIPGKVIHIGSMVVLSDSG